MSDQKKTAIIVTPALPATPEEEALQSIEVLEPSDLDDVAGGSNNGCGNNVSCLKRTSM